MMGLYLTPVTDLTFKHWNDFNSTFSCQGVFVAEKILEVESKARPFFIATFISLINGCLGADNAR